MWPAAAEEGDAMWFLSSRWAARAAAGVAFLVLIASGFAGDPKVDPVDLLQRIRSKVSSRLSQLPNYTCSETIDRFLKRPSTSLEPVDRVRLEVAFVGSRELYAEPGGQFQEGHASRLVSTGTISDGEFGSHMVSLFRTDKAEFEFAGMGKKDGHKTYKYNFRMSQEKSNFLLKHDSAQGIVPYQGSFWADASTLDIVRLEIKANRIPSQIGIDSVSETIRYQMISTADSEFLLPQSSELAVTYDGGNYSLNMVKLERCREYTGESSVAFGSAARSAEDPDKKAADTNDSQKK
jgi:hypothetical protein